MIRKVLILAGIFVAFYLGAHFYLRWKNRVEVDTIKTSRLVECEPNQVRAFQILQREGAKEVLLKFSRTDAPESGLPPAAQLAKAEWQEEVPAAGEADTTVMNHIASLICEIYDPIPQRPMDMEENTSADRHAQRMEFTIENKGRQETHRLEFGAVGGDRQNLVRYQAAKGEQVVKISPQLLQLASSPAERFLNSRLLRLDMDNVQVLTVSMDGKERFSLERSGSDWRVKAQGKEVKGKEPAENYANRLNTLRALSVKPGKGADCEKQPNKVAIRMQALGGKQEFVGFNYEKSGMIRGCDSARNAVFEVHRDLLKYIDLLK